MALSPFAKNGPKTQLWLKLAFFWHGKRTKIDFFVKKLLLFPFGSSKKCHFCWNWVFGPILAIWFRDNFLTSLENKKWFFLQKNHFSFSEQFVFVARKSIVLLTQNYSGKFCYCGPQWIIFIHGYFGCPGGPLSPCDSLLLGFWLLFKFILRHCVILCVTL